MEFAELIRQGPHVPTEKRAKAQLERAVALGELEQLEIVPIEVVPRYLVTYMNSQTRKDSMRSATVVSVTNQSKTSNLVTVTFYRGLCSAPSGTATYSIPPLWTIDFGSRHLPSELTVTNAVPSPELDYHEGRAIVSSMWPQIGVSARVYYTSGDGDERLLAVTDSKIVVYGEGNSGD